MWDSSYPNRRIAAIAAAKERAQREGADQLAHVVPTDLIRQFTIISLDDCTELEAWFSL